MEKRARTWQNGAKAESKWRPSPALAPAPPSFSHNAKTPIITFSVLGVSPFLVFVVVYVHKPPGKVGEVEETGTQMPRPSVQKASVSIPNPMIKKRRMKTAVLGVWRRSLIAFGVSR
ncbi:hypothetical protein SLEP1_g279 [Rubroshorea leprosula]|uniref:Transmembrane protein n=1 Tax=Rubroshorea leprosula TaxID=152421 RepID=A0AAV5HJC4_9ROSI|nr:hypothetical protein SLEP1_g279 [Rubroshorea leprosula]